MARELNVADHVEIGAIAPSNRAEMAALLSKAAVVTLLSEYETHPMAVLEAAALGRPVLVTDTSGLSELAELEVARAIPMQSTPDQVATAVLDQLSHPFAPSRDKLPTWDQCAAELLALYQATAERTPCAS
jgi:glycosyltransferase involved in cell wall biosynthesis